MSHSNRVGLLPPKRARGLLDQLAASWRTSLVFYEELTGEWHRQLEALHKAKGGELFDLQGRDWVQWSGSERRASLCVCFSLMGNGNVDNLNKLWCFRFRKRHPTIDVRLGDIVRFVCPETWELPDGESLTVYEVSEFAHGECSRETNSREVLRCASETLSEKMLRVGQLGGRLRRHAEKKLPKNVAQLIRAITPVPGGKEYQVGQNVFYMSKCIPHFIQKKTQLLATSTGKQDGIDQLLRGLCVSKNMRLTMKVEPSQPQPPPHLVSPMSPTRRQEDFVTKSSSAEMTDRDEDEDSENDNAHLLPRDLDTATSSKFRRPSQFDKAAASAGVQDQQFMNVSD